MGQIKRLGLLLVFLLIASAISPLSFCLAASSVSVNSGSGVTLDEGGTVAVTVEITGIPSGGLGGFTINLNWDYHIVDITSIALSKYEGFNISAPLPYNGSTTITGFSLGGYLEGQAVIATLNLQAVGGPGSNTSINASVVSMVDKDGLPVICAAAGAAVRISTPPVEHTLIAATLGGGSTSPGAGSHAYTAGTVIDISALPAEGWAFERWTGDVADPASAETTIVMDGDKTVTAVFLELDLAPPVAGAVVAANITMTAADIIWVTDEPGTTRVEYSAGGAALLSPEDEGLATVHRVHLEGLKPATVYRFRVISRDAAGNEMASGDSYFTTLGRAATLVITRWDISGTSANGGVELALSVTNSGDLPGSRTLELMVEGAVEEAREINLEPGASEDITFTITREQPGSYAVSIEGLSFFLEVSRPWRWGWWAIGGIIGICLVPITGGLILMRRRRTIGPRDELHRMYHRIVTEERRNISENALSAQDRDGDRDASRGMVGEEIVNREEGEGEAGGSSTGTDADGQAPAMEEGQAEPAANKGDRNGILAVTPAAVSKLRQELQTRAIDSASGFRLVVSPLKPGQLRMVIDRDREGDFILENEGTRILLLSPDVATIMKGMTLDYQKGLIGSGFSVTSARSSKRL